MNTQEIKCFLRVAERLNFSRAAQELYLTPPTVTHHIQKLEGELGVRLFQRDSKSVRLTLEGEVFYRDAQEIMMKIENARARLRDIKKSKQTLLRIGCTAEQEMTFLTDVLSRLRRRYPDADPRFTTDDFSHLLRMLKENQLDLVLGSRDMMEGMESCCFTPLYACRSCAVFGADLPVGTEGESVSLGQLKDFPLVVLRPKNIPVLESDCIERFLTSKPAPRQVVRQDGAAAVLALVRSGYGIGILPEYALSAQDRAALRCLGIEESPWIEYGLIHSRDNKNPCIANFLAIACELKGTKGPRQR